MTLVRDRLGPSDFSPNKYRPAEIMHGRLCRTYGGRPRCFRSHFVPLRISHFELTFIEGGWGVILLTSAISIAVSAWEQDKDDEGKLVEMGFKIAPVHLKLENKDRDLVGLGSYLVNAVAVCNDCHSPAGSMGPEEYVPSNNPYFGQKKIVNAAVYLSGGMDFGPIGPGSPDIVSRNLTPDKTGLPEGGRPFSQFLTIMRTGKDFDLVHPPCTGAPAGTCLPAMDGDGNLLQIMPWPVYQSMTEHQLRAIYEYLSAVPCVEGPPAPSVLHNDCS